MALAGAAPARHRLADRNHLRPLRDHGRTELVRRLLRCNVAAAAPDGPASPHHLRLRAGGTVRRGAAVHVGIVRTLHRAAGRKPVDATDGLVVSSASVVVR